MTEPELSLNWQQIYLGISLTTLATLLLELALTRIFAVVFLYHFAFLTISVALFGLGMGGLFSYALRYRGRKLFRALGGISLLTGISVIGSLLFVLTQGGSLSGGTLALLYFVTALPFFLSGCVVATVIAETVHRVDRVYFFDLLGAATGCLLLVPLLDFVGGPHTVAAAAILFTAAASIWYTMAGSQVGRVATVTLGLALAALVVANNRWPLIEIRFAKGEALGRELLVKWNSYSRVAVTRDDGVLTIRIDGGESSRISTFDLDALGEQDRETLLSAGPGLPYALRDAPKTLVMEPGGGWDVARAVAAGSRDVTGVESNPIIATTVMRRDFAEASHRLYFRPEVHIVAGDARNYLRSSQEHFQILQATLEERPASSAAGAMAFAENNLLTSDAFADYLHRLTADGMLAFSAWENGPPHDSLRLVSLAMAALRAIGEIEPWTHVIVVTDTPPARTATRYTVLVSRRPFLESDLAKTRAFAERTGVEPRYLPGDTADNPFVGLLLSGDPEKFARTYPLDITPVNDNRPFFFYSAQPRTLSELVRDPLRRGGETGAGEGAPLLVRLLGAGMLATVIVLVLPPLFLGSRLPRDPGVRRFLWYFVFVGAGYILVQVALIQKFVLFLGHPTYALAVIIFSMLASSGLGSYYSRRITGTSDASLKGVLAVAALLVGTLAVVISPLLSFGAGWPTGVKVIIALLVVAPAGFVMGVPFPTGLDRLGTRHSPAVRWAWSVNAAASVMGTACALYLAVHLGLRETLLFGGVMYLLALVTVQVSAPSQSRPG